jgi:hypothetical protein
MDDMLGYLVEFVEPAIKDFEEHPISRRHAFQACVAAFHAVDYLAYPRRRSAALRQEFGRRSPDFRIVDQVAHSFKHVISGDRANPDLKMGDVIPRPPAFCGVMVVGLSRLGDTCGGVTLNGDHAVDLLGTVKRAVTFLRSLQSDAAYGVTSASQSLQLQAQE